MRKAPHNLPAAGAWGEQLTLIDPPEFSPGLPTPATLADLLLTHLLDGELQTFGGRITAKSKRLPIRFGSFVGYLDVDLKCRNAPVTTGAIAFDDFNAHFLSRVVVQRSKDDERQALGARFMVEIVILEPVIGLLRQPFLNDRYDSSPERGVIKSTQPTFRIAFRLRRHAIELGLKLRRLVSTRLSVWV